MVRLSKLADYSLVLLSYFARSAQPEEWSARELAATSTMPLPTVSKVLKTLSRQGLLQSQRGVCGGYSLARHPSQISIAEVIAAVDGPIALTLCSSTPETACVYAAACPGRSPWQRINLVVYQTLAGLSLLDMLPSSPFNPQPINAVLQEFVQK